LTDYSTVWFVKIIEIEFTDIELIVSYMLVKYMRIQEITTINIRQNLIL